ncbi:MULTISPECIES: putative adhesin [Nitrospirillum]|uniref:Putative adhesin Stv domain-containing protein n=1 Tax=Nitrospirillum amazonense TaxID=28077 RepID=A0A560FQG4_9PROT|nr:hypothetical protein [Nitrospirillum amazonense]MEC4592951.1 hypothetical protein [Nitrospirillum amazonense]TWB23853.1 hypothetical protein FBZ88_11323 [Nitrospirillum amazonense]
MPDSFISGGGAAGLSMADWMDAEIPEGRLLIGPTRAIPAGMRRYALGGPTCSPIWRDARVIKYLHGLDSIGRLRLRRVVQGVDFRVSDTQLIDQAMRDLAMGSLSAFLIPRAVAPLSPPPVDPPRHDQGDEDPPGQPAQWSVTDRVVATLRRCVPLLPREMQQAAKSLFTRETLYWLAGFLVVWAGGHLAGYGEAIDVILLGVGYAMVGWSVFQGLNDLGHGIALATTAKTQHDLDEAAKRTAAGLTILTINAIIALVAKVKPASGGKRPVVEEPPPPPADPPLPPKKVVPPPPRKVILSGHGGYESGSVAIPEGTSVTVYSEHGATISDPLGNMIETGQDVSHVYSKTFGPGEVMPDYTLYPPDGLKIMGGQTVTSPTRLSELLQPNMGDVHWAACTYEACSPAANIMYGTDGIYKEVIGPSGKPSLITLKEYGAQ